VVSGSATRPCIHRPACAPARSLAGSLAPSSARSAPPALPAPQVGTPAQARVNIFFIDSIVHPLWAVITELLPELQDRMSDLASNRASWEQLAQAPAPAAAAAGAVAPGSSATT
jgi:hypothetical protein